MVTDKQKKLAKLIVERTNKHQQIVRQDVLKEADYSTSSSTGHASRIINSKGVQKELAELGFDRITAKRVLGSILNSPFIAEMVTPENQIRAAQEVFKVTGEYAPTEIREVILKIDI